MSIENRPEADFPTDEDYFDPGDPDNYAGDTDADFSVPPPPSVYKMAIERWERKPGASGYEYINIALSIIGGPFDGRWVWDVLSLSPKAKFKWSQILIALGWTPKHGKVNRSDDEELAKWFDSGKTVKARTYIDAYNAIDHKTGRQVTKRNAKIKKYLEPGATVPVEESYGEGTRYVPPEPDDDDDMPF